MGTEALKQALDDCIINFDRRVLVTDLLQQYRLPYNEINDVLIAYIAEQEKRGAKFEKRFLVSGEEEQTNNEIYTIAKSESIFQEWMRKLKNAESALYSVEIAGGAKAAASVFKPMTWCAAQVDQTETRPALNWGGPTNGVSNGDTKPKVEAKQNIFGMKKGTAESTSTSKGNAAGNDTKKVTETASTVQSNSGEKNVKKSSPEAVKKQTTPEERKGAVMKPVNKKGIASFFGPGSNTAKTDSKKATGVVKPPSPKKVQDFFKKSAKTAPPTSKAAVKEEHVAVAANTSVQLFCSDDDEVADAEQGTHTIVDVDTSDDEAQLEALRRQCSEKDKEDADTSNAGTKKRRRIIDSDDEGPEVKHDKKDESQVENSADMDVDAETEKSETFLDDDGFVVTVKPKKAAFAKKQTKPITPKKSPSKQETNKKSTKATPKQTSKTKQGNIMNFFNKK